MNPAPYITLKARDRSGSAAGAGYVFAKDIPTLLNTDANLRNQNNYFSVVLGLGAQKVYFLPPLFTRIASLNVSTLRLVQASGGVYTNLTALQLANPTVSSYYAEADIVNNNSVHNSDVSQYNIYSTTGTSTTVGTYEGIAGLAGSGHSYPLSSFTAGSLVCTRIPESHGSVHYPNAVIIYRAFTAKLEVPLQTATLTFSPAVTSISSLTVNAREVSATLVFTNLPSEVTIAGTDVYGAAYSKVYPIAYYPDALAASIGTVTRSTGYGILPSLRMDTPYIIDRAFVPTTRALYLECTCPIATVSGSVRQIKPDGTAAVSAFSATATATDRVLTATLPDVGAVRVYVSVDLETATAASGRGVPQRRSQPGWYEASFVSAPLIPATPRQHLDTLPDTFSVSHVLTMAAPDGHYAVPRVQLGNMIYNPANVIRPYGAGFGSSSNQNASNYGVFQSWHNLTIRLRSYSDTTKRLCLLWSDMSVTQYAAPPSTTPYAMTEYSIAASDKFVVGILGLTRAESQLPASTGGYVDDYTLVYASLDTAAVPDSLKYMPQESP